MIDRLVWYIRISFFFNLVLAGYLIYHFSNTEKKETSEKKQETFSSIDEDFTPLEKEVQNLPARPRTIEKRGPHEDIYLKLRSDEYLELVRYRDPSFRNSDLRRYLKHLSSLKIYVLIEFKKPANFMTIQDIRNRGFVAIKPPSEYVHKTLGVFYVAYRLLPSLRANRRIKDIYLLKSFTANGNYTLLVTSEESNEGVEMLFHLPISKPGFELLHKSYDIRGQAHIYQQEEKDGVLRVKIDIRRKKRVTFVCRVKYKIDLEDLLSHHVRVIGDMTIEEYITRMSQDEDYRVFTSFSDDKIILSDYIAEVAGYIHPTNTLRDTWHYIFKRLNQDIRYDYEKRYNFFNGRIVYRDIKDMYMTAAQLGEQRIGACPERSSLETAILRYLGIAARTATRLYHIYTEIKMPDQKWVTTSGLLKEIRLCASKDERQSYFVSWAPAHPFRLKWEGDLYPAILY